MNFKIFIFLIKMVSVIQIIENSSISKLICNNIDESLEFKLLSDIKKNIDNIDNINDINDIEYLGKLKDFKNFLNEKVIEIKGINFYKGVDIQHKIIGLSDQISSIINNYYNCKCENCGHCAGFPTGSRNILITLPSE